MQPVKLNRPWLHAARLVVAWLFWPAVAVVVWGELSPAPEVPETHDKLLHFIAYFGLALIASMATKSRQAALWATFWVIVLGGVLEVVQGFVGRDASVYDELANTAGALVGILVARVTIEPLRRRFAPEERQPEK